MATVTRILLDAATPFTATAEQERGTWRASAPDLTATHLRRLSAPAEGFSRGYYVQFACMLGDAFGHRRKAPPATKKEAATYIAERLTASMKIRSVHDTAQTFNRVWNVAYYG